MSGEGLVGLREHRLSGFSRRLPSGRLHTPGARLTAASPPLAAAEPRGPRAAALSPSPARGPPRGRRRLSERRLLGPGRGGGARRGPRARRTCGPAARAGPAMAATHGSPGRGSEARAAAARTLSGAPGRRAKAAKRRQPASGAAPPAKRRNTTVGEAERTCKGRAQKVLSPRKYSVPPGDGKQEEKPCIKTSSLFKNNPELPELPRPVVKQVHETVFTPDTFHELGLHPHLISTINTVLKMSSLTSVQKRSIPALLEGRDALVRSQTGSGKTLAYCIPVVQSLQAMPSKVRESWPCKALTLSRSCSSPLPGLCLEC